MILSEIVFVHFLCSRDCYFTGARESRILDLLILIQLTILQSTTDAFLSLRSSDAEKKRPYFLGVFALSGKTATSPLNFLQGFENF